MSSSPDSRPFEAAGVRGEISTAFGEIDLDRELPRLLDAGSAEETLHWGRNYLYTARWPAPDGEDQVVVKQFRCLSIRDRIRRWRRGTQAMRSWQGAHALLAAGVRTPQPVLVAESRERNGPAWFVTRRIEGAFEMRYLCRALEAGTERESYPDLDVLGALTAVGSMLRRLHDHGIWHRDVSVGNVLIPEGGGEPWLVDLNRARTGRRLGAWRRTSDLSRLRIFRRPHQDVLLAAYWEVEPGRLGWRRRLYRWQQKSFLRKIALRDWIRRPFRRLASLYGPRTVHAHIPAAPEGAAVRDRVVWDRLSDQPHQHAGRYRRLAIRLGEAGEWLGHGAVVARVAPRIWRRYRELQRERGSAPVAWSGMGIALTSRGNSGEDDQQVELLGGLPVRSAFVRIHAWDEDLGPNERLARRLADEGLEVSFGVAQNRDLVRDPDRWRAVLEEIGERFLPIGRRFQIGQAVNRSKWGVWGATEYARLAEIATETLRARAPSESVELFGPPMIDFEFHTLAAWLNGPVRLPRFDGVSSLLYVDRRGAPENRQLGFDTADKVTLLRAVAETAKWTGPRCWITEVNWPLREGPHSPAGRSVAVDADAQADYLVRYYLESLGTGLVERVFWWQLTARGYGLVDPASTGFVLRPAYRAMAALAGTLEGSSLVERRSVGDDARLWRFTRQGRSDVLVGWCVSGSLEVSAPEGVLAHRDRDGEPLPAPAAGGRWRLGGSPRYLEIAPRA